MQELDRRRSTLRYGWLAVILASLAVAPAFAAGLTTAVGAERAEPAEEAAPETLSLPATSAGSTEATLEAASGYAWHLLSHEYCPDRFGTTCPNGATSADPCPVSEPEGKACSIPGDRCWYVLSAWWADEYRCL